MTIAAVLSLLCQEKEGQEVGGEHWDPRLLCRGRREKGRGCSRMLSRRVRETQEREYRKSTGTLALLPGIWTLLQISHSILARCMSTTVLSHPPGSTHGRLSS